MYDALFRLRIESEQLLPLTEDFEPENLVEMFTGAIVTWDPDTDEETEIGWGSFYRVRLGVALNCGLNAFDACDSFSQDVYEYAAAVLDPATGDLREALYDEHEFAPGDLLILHMLEVLPAFRGWNMGLVAAQQIIEYYGQGLVILRPQPLQFLEDTERRRYHDEMEYSRFPGPREAATGKIREYWAQLGFWPIDQDFMVLDSTLKRDKVNLRRVGDSGARD